MGLLCLGACVTDGDPIGILVLKDSQIRRRMLQTYAGRETQSAFWQVARNDFGFETARIPASFTRTMRTILTFTLGVLTGVGVLLALQHPLSHIRLAGGASEPPRIMRATGPIGCSPAGLCK